MSDKIDAVDLILNFLQEHEKKLDELVNNFDVLIEERAHARAREILRDALDAMEDDL